MIETLVSSGGFRVDRLRALEVLGRCRLGDPRDFLVPWLRLAEALEATRAELRSLWRGLELRFDGDPILAECLEDPYECLFGRRDRLPELVAGLLGALRLEPRRVSIRSGERARSVRLTIDQSGRQSVVPEPAAPAGTALEVEWGGWFTGRRTRECLRRAAAVRADLALAVRIDGQAS